MWSEDAQAFFRSLSDTTPIQCEIKPPERLADWIIILAPGPRDPVADWLETARGIGLRTALVLLDGDRRSSDDYGVLAPLIDLVITPIGDGEECTNTNRFAEVRHGSLIWCQSRTLHGGLEQWRPLTRIWCYVDNTVATAYNSGVQRLVRALSRSLQDAQIDVAFIAWDEDRRSFRALRRGEQVHLARWHGPIPSEREAPMPAQLDWIIVPEIPIGTGPDAATILQAAREVGARIGFILFDLIPHKQSPFGNPTDEPIYDEAVARQYHAYWRTIVAADAIFPISLNVSQQYEQFLRYSTVWQAGLERVLRPIQLGGDLPGYPRVQGATLADRDEFKVLAVGTLEPRKNYARLIRGFDAAADRCPNRRLILTVAGSKLPNPVHAQEIALLAANVSSRNCEVRLVHDADDEALRLLYADADVVVYASYDEGFGLPILECAWLGAPCLCHNEGAIAETAEGGGAHMINMLSENEIAGAIVHLAQDAVRTKELRLEAQKRPIRTWRQYAADLVLALSDLSPPRFHHAKKSTQGRRAGALLSICISTYNRANWLRFSLPRLQSLVHPYEGAIEVVVCDNASTDATPDVISAAMSQGAFRAIRNEKNVGLLGNLSNVALAARGQYVWVLGDDDILVVGVIENVLEALIRNPDAEMAYLNYALTSVRTPPTSTTVDAIVRDAIVAGPIGGLQYVRKLQEVATLTENIFTAIYACVFRRVHALGAFVRHYSDPPFTSLESCVPSAVYVLRNLLNSPAVWIGEPGLVANLNVSWGEHSAMWRFMRLTELYNWVEREGLGGGRLNSYRWSVAKDSPDLLRALVERNSHYPVSEVDVVSFVASNIHLRSFRDAILPHLRAVYRSAAREGHIVERTPSIGKFEEMFRASRY